MMEMSSPPSRTDSSPSRHVYIYIMSIVAAALLAYTYTLRKDTVFSCPGTGYSATRFLAYCYAKQYGDFEHGAFWFGLEPALLSSVQASDVIFLGNSRMQFGFSSETVD